MRRGWWGVWALGLALVGCQSVTDLSCREETQGQSWIRESITTRAEVEACLGHPITVIDTEEGMIAYYPLAEETFYASRPAAPDIPGLVPTLQGAVPMPRVSVGAGDVAARRPERQSMSSATVAQLRLRYDRGGVVQDKRILSVSP